MFRRIMSPVIRTASPTSSSHVAWASHKVAKGKAKGPATASGASTIMAGGVVEGKRVVFAGGRHLHRGKRFRKMFLRGVGLSVVGFIGFGAFVGWRRLSYFPSQYFLSNATSEHPPSREEEEKFTLAALQTTGNTSDLANRGAYDKTYKWESVAPTLRRGDLVLLMGTAGISAQIIGGCHFYSLFKPGALRYSHSGMVVGDPHLKKTELNVPFIEAIDNRDIKGPDHEGNVRLDQVQVSDAGGRVFGKEEGRWCYSRCAVRRLHGVEWTPERVAKLQQLVNQYQGKCLNKDKAMIAAYISEPLFDWLRPKEVRGSDISCGELMALIYRELGIIEDNGLPSIAHCPMHFAEGCQMNRLPFIGKARLGPEIRVALPGASEYMDPNDPIAIEKQKFYKGELTLQDIAQGGKATASQKE